MSVYSGFGTRLQESTYDKLIEGLVQLFTVHVVAQFKHQSINEELWVKQFVSVYKKLWKLELHKYQPPKLTWACKDLADAVGCTNSRTSSNSSSQIYRKTRPFNTQFLEDAFAEDALELIKEVGSIQESVFDIDPWVKSPTPPPKNKSSSSPYIRRRKGGHQDSLRPHLLASEQFRANSTLRRKTKLKPDASLLS